MDLRLSTWPGRRLTPWISGCLLLGGCALGGPTGPDRAATGVERVVFVRDNQIFAAGAGGTHLKALTDPGGYRTPVWSPDGMRVAFLRWEGALMDATGFVGTVGADGRNERSLFEGQIMLGSLSWSPDGRSLLFMMTAGRMSQRQIVVLDAASGAWHTVPDTLQTRWLSGASWSPQERRIFYGELVGLQWDIFSVGADGEGLRQVTDDPYNDIYPSVSPDGMRVAFFSDRTGEPRLFVGGTSGGAPGKLTDLSGVAHRVRWSPDGTRVAFVGAGHIYTIAADGTDARQVTAVRSAYLLHSWSPGGRYLAFMADMAQGDVGLDPYEVYTVDLATGEQAQVLDVAGEGDVLWAGP